MRSFKSVFSGLFGLHSAKIAYAVEPIFLSTKKM